MGRKNQKGAVLITLIIAMTVISAFGAAIYSLTSSSSFGELLANGNDNAYDLARAGIRYGINLRTFTFGATTFQLPDANHTFTLQIAGGVITSTGVVNPGTFLEARRVLSYDASWAPSPSSSVINMSDLISSSPIVNLVGGQPSTAITTNPTANTVNLGGGIADSYGSLWYQGNSAAGYCTNGACNFGTGIRAYFDFTVTNEDYSADSTNSADGFTFTVMSALLNSRDRTGGAAAGISQGELMGYAGPDSTTDNLGLRPPKLALEFDTYPNNGSTDVCSSGSRNDPTPFSNHVALMFWGDRTIAGTCSGTYPKDSFDDNRHGAGGLGGDPVNTPTNSDPGYYQGVGQTCRSSANTCNWMEDGYTYSARMEITRPSAANGGGTYDYQINAWVLKRTAVTQLTHFQDVMTPYTDAAPQIIDTMTLNQADHDNFSKIFFGFTEATGGRSQSVVFSDFRTYLPQGTDICSYAISPTTASPAAAGGSGSVGVTSTAACPWWAATVDPGFTSWLHITSGANGNGNGTVNYTVDANGGAPRSGTMTIAGQTFTVNQSVSCTYSINPTSASPGSGAVTGSTISVAATAGCAWTAISNSAWLTITGGASGTGNGTVTYSVAANTGVARTGTLTIAGQTFTVNQASGCTYSLSPGSTAPGSGAVTGSTVSVTAAAGCPWTAVSNNAWITITGGSGGTGNGTVTYNVAANTGVARTGTLTIAGQSFTVNQASGCTYSISPGSTAPGSGAVTGTTVSVTATAGCPWTAVSNDAWLTITGGASGTGNGTVTYNVAANTGPGRTGTLTIAGQTFTVTQASGCTYSLSPGSAAPGAAGATGSTVAVTAGAGCGWTAVSNNAWITVTGGASGTGNGTVSYNVAVNTGTSSRTGTMTIGGQTFTVTQAGACAGYRVWNNSGSTWDFRVTGQSCHTSVNSGTGSSEITTSTSSTQLQPGETVSRYTTAGTGCSSALQGDISYADAVTADTNGNCQVNYNSGDTAGDR